MQHYRTSAVILEPSRLDPYYYAPHFVAHAAKMRAVFASRFRMGDEFDVLDGTHDSVTTSTFKNDAFCISFLRSQDIGPGLLKSWTGAFLRRTDHHGKCKRSRIFHGDVLLNIMASTGEACFYEDSYPAEANANRAVGILRAKSHRISPEYKRFLCALLSSKVGNLELARNLKGSIQQRLNLSDISDSTVPGIDDRAACYVGDKLRQAERLRTRAAQILNSATQLIDVLIDGTVSEQDIEETGLKLSARFPVQGIDLAKSAKHNRTPSIELTSRIDAWYYQPRLLAAFHKIQSSGNCKTLAELIDLERDIRGGATPLGAEYLAQGDIRFYRTSDVSGLAVHDADTVFITNEQDEKMARSRLAEGDVLLTITGADFGHAGAICRKHLPGNIILRCLAQSPTERWTSVDDLSVATKRVKQFQLEYSPERSEVTKRDFTLDWSSDVVNLLGQSKYGQAEGVARRQFEVTSDRHAFMMMVSASMRDGRFFDAKRDFEARQDLLTESSPVQRDLRELALKCFLETREIDRALSLIEMIISESGESPNILLKKASILGLSARYDESREILLRLNRDFPGRPAILRRLVVVFEQVRDLGKASAFLKAFMRVVPNDAWANQKKDKFASLGYR